MNYSFRILSCLIAFIVLDNALIGQYDPENEVVTISKYHLKPLSEVENGSAAQRNEVMDEQSKKINPLRNKLKGPVTVGNCCTGTSLDIIAVNRWKSFADADESVVTKQKV